VNANVLIVLMQHVKLAIWSASSKCISCSKNKRQ